jgi:uncharacterized protein YggE
MAVRFSSTQRAIAVGVASAGLLIGAFTLGAGQGSAAPATAGRVTGNAALTAAAASAAPAGTRITVTGTGDVSGVPNQLALSMGVQTSGTSVAAALRQANSAVRSITAVLRHGGVAASDIQTSGLSIYPNYSGSSGVPDGYQVSEQLTITLRRLSVAGSQISAAARAGGNATVIDGVSLNLSDTSTLLASARAKAVADAKAKAAAYARALGRPLGPVVSMSETPVAQPYPVPEFANPSASRAASSVPVHPGTQQLSVTVTVIFALGS